MGSSRFYGLLSALLFAAVCAYAGAAAFSALSYEPEARFPVLAKAEGGELRGIILRYEKKVPDDLIAADGERIAADGKLLSESAVYFSQSDGFEALSPDDAQNLCPESLEMLMQTKADDNRGPKLIYGFDCYYAAFYSGGNDIEPGIYRLKFENDNYSRRAELVSFSRSDSECTLLFRLMADSSLMQLRFCNAELVVA